MDKFKVGDLVSLKSGGPTMTILYETITANDYACAWFQGKDNKREKETYPFGALKRVEEERE